MNAAAEEAVVCVANLTKRFGAFVAVDAVSFDVGRGEIFGFLGPNGAGKTTTLRMLAGLLLPSSGGGRVAGFDILTQTESIKRRIGYMSQLFSLYGDLTVAENIRFFSGLNGVPRVQRAARRDWALETAGLNAQQRQLTRDLPLGWKQRLALVCAVLHQPPILFLDEPTSGVDPLSRRRFWDLIYDFAAHGTTVFVSTHYMDEAEYCDRLALMNRGRLIALDSPSGLRARMALPLLQLQVDASPRAVAVLQRLPEVVDAALFGRAVHVTVPDVARGRAAIEAALAGAGVRLRAIEPVAPSLEDVFVALVRAAGGALAG